MKNDQFISEIVHNTNRYFFEDGGSGYIPPHYIKDKSYQEIPYYRFLASYYEIFKNFIKTVSTEINVNDWKMLTSFLSKYIDNITTVDMIDFLTTIVHNNAVVHAVDHESLYLQLTQNYGISTMTRRFDTNFTGEVNSLSCKKDILRTKVFADTFEKYLEPSYFGHSILEL